MDFISFDTETTGFGDDTEICQVSFVKFVDDLPSERFTTLIKPSPNANWVAAASKVNGIYKSTVKDAPRLREIQNQVKAFIGEMPIVAHNASFDINKWVSEGGFPLTAFCTQTLHQLVTKRTKKMKLEQAASEFGLSTLKLHDAEQDSILCGRLFLALAKQANIGTSAELESRFPGAKVTPTERSVNSTKAASVTEHSMRKSDFESLSQHPKFGSVRNSKLSGKLVIFSKTQSVKASDGQLAMALFGGRSLDNVSKETDYLVVTDPESAKRNPSTKVKAALHLIERGAKLQIISEETFIAWAGESLDLSIVYELWNG